MNRSAGNIFHPIVFQRLVNQLFLIGKRSNDTNALIRMFFDKRNNLFHFLRRCILIVGGICWNILKNQRISFFIRTVDNQLVVIIFFIIKWNNFFIAAVMVAEQNFLADCITCQIGLINGILYIIILICHSINPLKLLIIYGIQQNYRAQLLRVTY